MWPGHALVLTGLVLLTSASGASAAEPPGDLHFEWLGVTAGLAGDTARALAAGPPGTLYVGTNGGLARFDGARFEAMAPPAGVPVDTVTALLFDDPRLYATSATGVWVVEDGEARLLRDGGREDIHAQWAVGPDGVVWLAEQSGLWRMEPGGALALVDERAWRGVAVDEAGTVWVCGLDGVFRGGPGGVQVFAGPTRRLLALPGDRGVAIAGRGLFVARGETVHQLADGVVVTDLTLLDGRLVGTTNLGLLLADSDDRSAVVRSSQHGSGILVRVAADDEGQLWVGELGRGVARVTEPGVRIWNPIDEKGQAISDKVLGVTRVDERLLVIAGTARWWVDADLRVTAADLAPGWWVSAAPLPDSTWVVVDNDVRTWRMQSDGERRLLIDSQRGGDRLIRLAPGTVLAPGEQGIWQAWPEPAQEVPYAGHHVGVAVSRPGADGGLLTLGSEGLHRWASDGFEALGPGPADCGVGFGAISSGDAVVAVCADATFVGRGGDWSRVALDERPRALAEHAGEVWGSGLGELFRIEPAPQRFGPGHGLPDGPYRFDSLVLFGDWLVQGRAEDVLFVDRARLTRVRRTPRPRIGRVEKLLGDRAVRVRSDSDLVPGDSFLRLQLEEDSLRPTESIRWRFRFDDGPWSSPQAEPQVNLPGVQPGRHRVEVQVRVSGGGWSEPVRWVFRLPPRWYERRDVQLGAILVLVLIFTGFLVERARRLRSELNTLQEREQFRQVFGRFVAPEVADEVLGGGLKAEGEERELTVLFADLRGFTPLTESLPPKELVALLNTWLTAMVEEIEREGGIVNKFLGDAVVAIFGAPRAQPDHAVRAARAGIAMARRTVELGGELAAGIGVNTGRAIAGPIGAQSRMEYTVIGEVVNVAARVEALTRTLAAAVLITDATHEAMGDPSAVSGLIDAGEHPLKGVGHDVRVWRWDLPESEEP